MPSSRGSSQPRDQTQFSRMAGRFFTIWATIKAHIQGEYTLLKTKELLGMYIDTVTMENSIEVPSETKSRTTIWPRNPSTGNIPWENRNSKRHMHSNVHCNTTYSSQDLEAAWMFIERWVDKEDVVCLYNGIFVVAVRWLSHVCFFATPWTVAHQAFLSSTVSRSLLKFMSIELVMLSGHIILCHLLLLPSIFPSIRVNGILLIHKKEQCWVICRDVNGPRVCHTEWGYSERHKYHVCVLFTQPCPTLRNPMDCSLPGSSVHGIHQARTLEWVAIPFSRESSQPGDWTWVSCTAGRSFMIWAIVY